MAKKKKYKVGDVLPIKDENIIELGNRMSAYQDIIKLLTKEYSRLRGKFWDEIFAIYPNIHELEGRVNLPGKQIEVIRKRE